MFVNSRAKRNSMPLTGNEIIGDNHQTGGEKSTAIHVASKAIGLDNGDI